MPTPTCETRPDGALVVEADTAADALAEIGTRLGHDAEILEARKVHRGGWKGFFAREVVQLTASAREPSRAPGTTPAQPSRVVSDAGGAADGGGGLLAAVSQLTREADDEEQTFREVLLRSLAAPAHPSAATTAQPPAAAPAPPQDAVAPAPPAPSVRRSSGDRAPAPAHRRPAGARVAWSLDGLHDLRLPTALLDACAHLDPDDDAAWVTAIAGAVSSLCRPLPSGPAALVGPQAHRLGVGLGFPVAHVGAYVPADGPIALKVDDTHEGRRWTSQAVGDRWLHLVAGGRRWHGFLFDDVLAVSWAGAAALPAALGAASRMGLVLGYGHAAGAGVAPVRATGVDIALTIRSLLPRTTS